LFIYRAAQPQQLKGKLKREGEKTFAEKCAKRRGGKNKTNGKKGEDRAEA